MLIKGICERQLSARHNPSYPPALVHGARLGPGLGGSEHKGRQWHRPYTSRSGPLSHVWASPSRSQAVQGRPQAARIDISVSGAASLPQPTTQQITARLYDGMIWRDVSTLLQQLLPEPQPLPVQQPQLQPQHIRPAAAPAAMTSGSTSQQQYHQQQQGLGPLPASSSYSNTRSTSSGIRRSDNTSSNSRRPIAAPAAASSYSDMRTISSGTNNTSTNSKRYLATPAAPRQAAPAAAATQRALPYCRLPAAATRQSAARGPVAASAARAGGAGIGDDAAEVDDLSGLWAKDRDRSDAKGYDAILDVLGLSGLQKVTARLIEGLEIRQSADQFIVNFVTVVPFFKVTEVVPLNAGSTQQSRRDLRRGTQTAAAKTVDGGVFVEMSWGQPMAGSLTEVYSLLPDGSLCVHAEVRVGQKQATADTIYTISKGSRDALLSDSNRRNGS